MDSHVLAVQGQYGVARGASFLIGGAVVDNCFDYMYHWFDDLKANFRATIFIGMRIHSDLASQCNIPYTIIYGTCAMRTV